MDTSPMSRTDLFIALFLSMLFIVDDFFQKEARVFGLWELRPWFLVEASNFFLFSEIIIQTKIVPIIPLKYDDVCAHPAAKNLLCLDESISSAKLGVR